MLRVFSCTFFIWLHGIMSIFMYQHNIPINCRQELQETYPKFLANVFNCIVANQIYLKLHVQRMMEVLMFYMTLNLQEIRTY